MFQVTLMIICVTANCLMEKQKSQGNKLCTYFNKNPQYLKNSGDLNTTVVEHNKLSAFIINIPHLHSGLPSFFTLKYIMYMDCPCPISSSKIAHYLTQMLHSYSNNSIQQQSFINKFIISCQLTLNICSSKI